MNHEVGAPTNLDKAEEENCVSIFRSIMRTYNRLHGIGSDIADDFGLHLAEMNVVDMLGRHGPLSMGELSRIIFIAPSSTTRTVKNLQSLGLVKRARSAESERVVMVSLTKAGNSLFKKSYPAILLSVQDCLTSTLNKTERKALAKLLKKLAT
jgi:DNA-binding MarR family transcriptional regulator